MRMHARTWANLLADIQNWWELESLVRKHEALFSPIDLKWIAACGPGHWPRLMRHLRQDRYIALGKVERPYLDSRDPANRAIRSILRPAGTMPVKETPRDTRARRAR